MSNAQESPKRGTHRGSWTSPGTQFSELKGYLRKRSRAKRWQRRFFEANDHYLTYYKSQNSDKLLACIDLRQVSKIDFGNGTPEADPGEFYIELAGRIYVMRAKTYEVAKKWVEGLVARQQVVNMGFAASDLAEEDPTEKKRTKPAASVDLVVAEPEEPQDLSPVERKKDDQALKKNDLRTPSPMHTRASLVKKKLELDRAEDFDYKEKQEASCLSSCTDCMDCVIM